MSIEKRGIKPTIDKIFGDLVVRIKGLGFNTYNRTLFDDLDLNVRRGEVVTVSGRSGSGKTVLLQNIGLIESPMEGEVFHLPGTKVGYSPQDMEDDAGLSTDMSIRDMLSQARGLPELEAQMRQLESRMGTEPDKIDRLMDEYGNVTDKYEKLNGYNAESEMGKLLTGLKVDEHSTGHVTLGTKLSEVSSGQRKRLMLARALFAKPDLAVLDEPTSHLDVESVSWLSSYLRTLSSVAVVMASNNRDFVDATTDTTVGLTDSGRVFVYTGGLTDFETKRDALLETEKGEAKVKEKHLDQLVATDNKFREVQAYRRSSDMAQVGRALGSRIERLKSELSEMPGSKPVYRAEQIPEITFNSGRQSGNDVIAINGVVKRYGDYTAVDLKKSGTIQIRRGENIWLEGENGSGKSTLMRMIHSQSLGDGSFLPDEGSIKIGASVDVGYFNPDTSQLPREGILLDVAGKLGGETLKGRVVAVLNFFGFDGESVHRQDVSTLSHGEKQRLQLAGAMMQKPNLLLVDEPTGDFMPDDVQSRVASALKNFGGTVVLVSHDPSFVRQFDPDKVMTMPSGRVKPLK